MAAAAAAAENGGAPRTELQELQMKSNQVTDEVSRRVGGWRRHSSHSGARKRSFAIGRRKFERRAAPVQSGAIISSQLIGGTGADRETEWLEQVAPPGSAAAHVN